MIADRMSASRGKSLARQDTSSLSLYYLTGVTHDERKLAKTGFCRRLICLTNVVLCVYGSTGEVVVIVRRNLNPETRSTGRCSASQDQRERCLRLPLAPGRDGP